MGTQYQQLSMFSQKNNPYIYYFPFPLIVSVGAFAFYPQVKPKKHTHTGSTL